MFHKITDVAVIKYMVTGVTVTVHKMTGVTYCAQDDWFDSHKVTGCDVLCTR